LRTISFDLDRDLPPPFLRQVIANVPVNAVRLDAVLAGDACEFVAAHHVSIEFRASGMGAALALRPALLPGHRGSLLDAPLNGEGVGRTMQRVLNRIIGEPMTAAALNIISRFQTLDARLLRQRLHDFAANGGTRRRVSKRERLQDQRNPVVRLQQVA
jgi:hypothetical protein